MGGKITEVFVGWSNRAGDTLSHRVAELVRDLIITTLPGTSVFLSTSSDSLPTGLPTGKPWFPGLYTAASQAKCGIFCLSPSNHWARWMAFEAGIIACLASERVSQNILRGDAGRRKKPIAAQNPIVPLLIGDATGATLEGGPFAQFQIAKSITKEQDIRDLLEVVIKAVSSDSRPSEELRDGFEGRFKASWQVFNDQYERARKDNQSPRKREEPSIEESRVLAAISHLATSLYEAVQKLPAATRNEADATLLKGFIYEGLITNNWFDTKDALFPNVGKVLQGLAPDITSGTAIMFQQIGKGAKASARSS